MSRTGITGHGGSMRVIVFGATGVLGRALVPTLLEEGHEVRAFVRSPEKAQALSAAGVEVCRGDMLDESTCDLLPAIMSGGEAVLHLATAIPRNFAAPGAWEANTRLRVEGTRLLLDAALASGVERYIQQSIVMAYIDGGDRLLDEETPLDTSPARAEVCAPVIAMEGMVRAVSPSDLRWTILRGGSFVGPGTAQDDTLKRLREGTATVLCDGSYYISPVNVSDMAAAIVAALRRAPGGSVLNIVDEPLRQGEYLDRLAALIGAPPPKRNPTVPCPPSFRCSNAAARAELGWIPRYGIWPQHPF